MGTKFSTLFRCFGAVALLALAGGLTPQPASAQTCVQDEYNQVNKQKLNCTANDVRIAKVTNIRDPQTGATLTSCIAGAKFNFLADFEIVTTSSQARENIGLYIATNSQTTALTGSCVDHIISGRHPCTTNTSLNCGSDNYHETDPAPDNCGDTASGDLSGTFGAGAELVTLEIDNFLCEAPTGSNQVQLPNCTSWQIPGGTIQCVAPSPDTYPFNGPGGTPTAIPGSPSKCNCGIIPLGITVQTPSINVAKACNTATTNNPNPPDFTNLSAPNPSSCTLSPEGGTVTYTVDMVNDQSNFGSVVIDQVCDSEYGNIFTASTFTGTACAAGKQCVAPNNVAGTTCASAGTTPCSAVTIAFGASSTCNFTVNQPESKTVTDTVQVAGHGTTAGKFGPTSSNSVTVISGEAASSATVTKGVVATEAACATVRYSVDVKNTSASGTDETQTLTALNDSAFGGLTSIHDSVLGTTCGQSTSGLGTLSGSSGAGALPSNLTVGGTDYTCQFDAQFCSALDASGCISNTDKVTASLTGDESGEAVTQTANTLQVKECLVPTVTSQ